MTIALASPISAKQDESIRESTARVNIWDGSIRSGKTIASILRFIIAVMYCPPGGQIVMIGRTRDSVWRNVLGPLQDSGMFSTISKAIIGNYGAPTVMILGRVVHVLGAHDSKSEKVIRGMTVSLAYVDEVTVIGEEFFTQLLGRMSVPGAQLFGTTNPDSPAHWLKRKFLDRIDQLPDWRRFHFQLADNPGLTAAYVESISREFTGLWHRRFILGEWVQAEGAIYDMWDPARHVVTLKDLPEMERVISLGIDYGTTNPTRGLLVGLAKQKLWTLDEWSPPTGLTDAAQSQALRKWMGSRHPLSWRDPEWVFVDPAAASFKVQLFTDGLNNVGNGANAVLPGIRTIASLLATDQLGVLGSNCPNLVEQIPGYAWDPKKTAKGEDAPIKRDDHEVDAWRYAIHTARALWRDDIPTLTGSPTAPGADEDDLEEAA